MGDDDDLFGPSKKDKKAKKEKKEKKEEKSSSAPPEKKDRTRLASTAVPENIAEDTSNPPPSMGSKFMIDPKKLLHKGPISKIIREKKGIKEPEPEKEVEEKEE